jgi:hypothetical protein
MDDIGMGTAFGNIHNTDGRAIEISPIVNTSEELKKEESENGLEIFNIREEKTKSGLNIIRRRVTTDVDISIDAEQVFIPYYGNKTLRDKKITYIEISIGVNGGNYEKNVFEKMFSTFKFTEISDETADWQTYTNEEYGFEVRYPEDIIIDENPVGSKKLLGSVQFYFPQELDSSKKCYIAFDSTNPGYDPYDTDLKLWNDEVFISGKTYKREFWKFDNYRSFAFINIDYSPNPDSLLPSFSIEHSIESECLSKIDLILSTFKFIDQK